MNIIAVSFVLFSFGAASCLSALTRDWRAPALGIALAIGALMVASSVPIGAFKRLIPLATGAGIAGVALLPLAIVRPASSLSFRLAAGVIPATAAHLTFIIFAMAQR